MSRTTHRFLPLLGVSFVVALFCTLSRTGRAQEKEHPPEAATAAPAEIVPEKMEIIPALVFVADGAGGYLNMTRGLKTAIDQHGCKVQVVTHEWSHGPSRYLADHFAYERARREGGRMATVIREYHREYPQAPIHVVGHSAGAAVALAALESLPETCVDRAFIISPSVSADYDIRPALKAVKQNLYVHYSSRDWFWMGVATRVAGSTDRRRGPNSGRFGFRVYVDDPESQGKLVQRNWEPSDRATGNNGGHFGGYENEFLRQFVVTHMAPVAEKRIMAGPSR